MEYLNPWIPKQAFVEFLTIAEKIYTSKLIQDHHLSSLLYSSWLHNNRGEYISSTLLSWIVLEIYIGMLLRKHLESENFTNKRIDEELRLPLACQLRILRECGAISMERFESLDNLRKARNDIVHRGKQPGSKMSRQYLDEATAAFDDVLREIGVDRDAIKRKIKPFFAQTR
ncbi:MAG: hypothetical protein DRO11_04215 [Methanobacteriota archaeon]|nr:MAG: hypothetical protein DRO11_04215 [Euryarchaeota archaeon]